MGKTAKLDEQAAVERLKRGDVGGLEGLVRKYHTRAGRAAFLIVRDHSLAEDVAQGAFVRAYERIGGFDAERPFGPWFMKIVVNNAVEAARRRERTTSYEKASVGTPMTWLVDPTAGPQELAEEAEERQMGVGGFGEAAPCPKGRGRPAILPRHERG